MLSTSLSLHPSVLLPSVLGLLLSSSPHALTRDEGERERERERQGKVDERHGDMETLNGTAPESGRWGSCTSLSPPSSPYCVFPLLPHTCVFAITKVSNTVYVKEEGVSILLLPSSLNDGSQHLVCARTTSVKNTG